VSEVLGGEKAEFNQKKKKKKKRNRPRNLRKVQRHNLDDGVIRPFGLNSITLMGQTKAIHVI
jgi:hypothetical protein